MLAHHAPDNVTMTGIVIRRIREGLGLPVATFATVLGVHPSTIHRWEAAWAAEVPIEGIPNSILTALRDRVEGERSDEESEQLRATGQEISKALVLGGVLVALLLLLAFAKGK